MVEEASGGDQQVAQGGEVLGRASRAHVLKHADRRDGIELLPGQISIVLITDLHGVLETGGSHPLPGPVHLLVAEGYTHHVGAMVASSMDGHRPPSAADVEQP